MNKEAYNVKSKEQMLKELGDIAAQRNNIKPKQARRAIAKGMKKATYEQWVELYKNSGGKLV